MDRRSFIKLIPATAVASTALPLLAQNWLAQDATAQDATAQAKVGGTPSTVKPGDHKEYMKKVLST